MLPATMSMSRAGSTGISPESTTRAVESITRHWPPAKVFFLLSLSWPGRAAPPRKSVLIMTICRVLGVALLCAAFFLSKLLAAGESITAR